jgi:hypothetical protein
MNYKEVSVIAIRRNAFVQKKDYTRLWFLAVLAMLGMLCFPSPAAAARRDKQAPTIPTGLIATPVGCSQVDLSWNASADVGTSGLNGYYLYRNGVLVKKVLAPATSASDTALAGSARYTYAILAVDNAGNKSAQTSPVYATTPVCASCDYAVSPTAASIGVEGSSGLLTVSAGTGCAWTPSSSAPGWLTCTPPGGTGSGTLSWSAARNSSTSSRTASLNIAGQTFTVTQAGAPCTYDISSIAAYPSASAVSGTVTVSADAGCGWTASSSAPGWLTCNPSTSTGSGLVSWSATANTATTPRSGTLNIAGLTFTVVQAGAGCTYAISPGSASVGSSAASGTITVTTDPGCNWTASSSSPAWLTCTPSSGTGSGSVTWSVTRNDSCTVRSSMLTVAGKVFAVNQQGTAGIFSISPASASIAAAGGPGSVTVTGGSDCTWTASSGASWITVSAGGSGSGTATYSAQPNTSSSIRSATLTIAGQTFLLTQAASIDSTPPIVALASPVSGSTVSGTINLSATATDNAGVTRVEFYRNPAVALGTVTSAPWTVPCDTKALPNGAHSFYCKAFDAAGNSAVSPSSTVTVSNATTNTNTTGQYLFADGISGPSSAALSYANATAVDAAGNVIVVGYFKASVDLGGSLVASAGQADIFVVKYSAQGAYLWSRRVGAVSPDIAQGVAVDSLGNIYVTGYFSDTVDFGFGPRASAGSSDLFLWKLSPQGASLWCKQFGGTGVERGLGVAVDGRDNVIMTGYFGAFGTGVDFGFGPLTSAGGGDLFVAKYASSGTPIWARRAGSTLDDWGASVAIDRRDDSVVVTGNMNGSVDFGGGLVASAGSQDIFLVKYSSTGSHVWSKRFGAADYEMAGAVAVDSNGKIALVGNFRGNVDLGAGLLTYHGSSDMFIAQFADTGACQWSKNFGSTAGNDVLRAIATDNNGNIIVTGQMLAGLDFGGGYLWGAGTVDVLIAKFGTSGNHLWSHRYAQGSGYGVAADPSGNMIASGCFSPSINFGGGLLNSSGNTYTETAFVVKLSQ